MKKVLLIMAAALMTMTQCRKQETVPATPSANTIKMTITAGPGAKTDITNEGAITWTSGDVLYVSDGTNWLGSLTLQGGAGNASGTFTGNISEISGGTTCHFFYLGHDNGMAAPTANTTTDVSISFASQDGSREGALKYHLGHGSADVTVSGGVATGAVAMRTEIAMAHLKLTMDSKPYTGSATMDVSNTMTVSPAGSFSGSGTDGITIGGTSGDRYVTLIPTGTSSVDVSFSGSATGSMTFGHGIQANNLYGMADGIEVTLAAPTPTHEYVDLGLPSGIMWATCNLGASSPEEYGDYYAWGEILPYYADGHSKDSPCSTWRNMTTGAGNTDISNGYVWKTYSQGGSNSFVEWTAKPYGSDNILTSAHDAATVAWGSAWRMPTEAEFTELINNTTCTWTDNYNNTGVKGRVFTSTKAGYTNKYIFLPAAGCRNSDKLTSPRTYGYYWSSSLNSDQSRGSDLGFYSSNFSMSRLYRYYGCTVRPVCLPQN